MRRTVLTTLLGLTLAGPAAAQVPNVQQLLQGLTTGNQNQDQALRDAFERGYRHGYQRGREDEARQVRSDRGGDRTYRRGTDEGYRDEQRGPDQPYGQRGDSYDR